MVLSAHLDLDLEAFLVVLERLFLSFVFVVRPVDCPNIMVRFGHWSRIATKDPNPDVETYLVLFERLFVLALPQVQCPHIMVHLSHLRMVASVHPDKDLHFWC